MAASADQHKRCGLFFVNLLSSSINSTTICLKDAFHKTIAMQFLFSLQHLSAELSDLWHTRELITNEYIITLISKAWSLFKYAVLGFCSRVPQMLRGIFNSDGL